MAAIALFGTVAYRALPVSDLPNVDFPTLQVTASLPGASPETMASAVATPLENQFSTIAGLIAMTSVNSLGSTQITLEFDLNRSLDGAAVDTQARHYPGLQAAAQQHAHAADLHQGESGGSAHHLRGADVEDGAAVHARTNTPRRAWRSASPPSAASRRCRCWASRNTPCTCRWIRTRWLRTRWASMRWKRRCKTGT